MKKDEFIVGVTSPSFCKNEKLREEILTVFPKTVFNTKNKKLNHDEMLELFMEVDALIVSMENIDSKLLNKLGNLKLISKFGVGLDNIDLSSCENLGVKVNFTPGVNKVSVAEMTIAFMISLSRNMYQSSILLKSGIWDKSNGGNEISNKNIGIIGCNNIGQEVIRMLEPFKCNIYINDLVEKSDICKTYKAKQVELDYLLQNCDIVSIHLPLNSKTKNLISINKLKLMKENSIIINTSRGGIVNEEDLFQALTNNFINAAALDVYDIEPPKNKKLLKLNNLYCTPHIGGNSKESVMMLGREAIKNLEIYF